MNAFIFPTDATKKEIYEFYLLINDSNFSLPKKRNLMSAALSYETWGWRVVGITKDALHRIASNNYNLPVGLQRDHNKQSRAETFNQLFDKTRSSYKQLSCEEWWDKVWSNDETILMTKEEHNTKKRGIEIKSIAIDYTLGYFLNATGPGMRFTKKWDGEYVRGLCAKDKIRE